MSDLTDQHCTPPKQGSAAITHQEDHHPDFEVGYKHCLIRYTTHAIGGLSENDFICAAKIDQLLK